MVIGCGYLGAVHAACMAYLGHEVHEVVGVDTEKVAILSKGEAPSRSRDCRNSWSEHSSTGRLRFTTDIAEACDAEAHFIWVGTPQRQGEFTADLTYVDAAVDALARHFMERSL